MRMASRRNLENMHRRHDWRHRLADIYADLGLARNARFEDSLETLSRRADEIGGQKDKSGEVKKTA